MTQKRKAIVKTMESPLDEVHTSNIETEQLLGRVRIVAMRARLRIAGSPVVRRNERLFRDSNQPVPQLEITGAP